MQNSKRRTFVVGHVYKIYSTPQDSEYDFCYEGKRGNHHMFRETVGGLTRTYTDSQLIGKNIVEEA